MRFFGNIFCCNSYKSFKKSDIDLKNKNENENENLLTYVLSEKNTQIKRYITKNFSYSTFNNIHKKNPEKKITKVLSFTKKSKSVFLT